MSRIALQLYTVRDLCANDLAGALETTAELGFEGVELHDLYDHPAHHVRALLDEAGLVACGRHAGLPLIEGELERLGDELATLGTDRLIVSWVEPPTTASEADAIRDRVAEAAERAAARGLRLGFHNHDGELAVLDDGRTLLDRFAGIAESLLFFELDLGWVWYATGDAVGTLERLGPRAPLIHVKDLRRNGEAVHVPLGRGDVRYDRLRDVAERAGVEWLIVEQDETDGPPFEAVGSSLAALRQLLEGGRMSHPATVGIIGCGVISHEYAANAPGFDAFEIVACADIDEARRTALAEMHGLTPLTPAELLESATLDIVLNLTPPVAHREVSRIALEHGKHVYSEKPLGMVAEETLELLALADARGLQIGCAPDIFLGGAYQEARALIDLGAIGTPLAVSATMLGGGQETWHPDPDIFFQDGAGPLLDMGPYYLSAIVTLLGPIARVAGFASTLVDEREIQLGARAGQRFRAETPTHTAAVMHLASGALATLIASFEAPSHYASTMLVLGSDGTLSLPDPNMFEGSVRMRQGRGDWVEVPYSSRGRREARGIGLQDLAEAIALGRAPRASGALAHHVVDVGRSILAAAADGQSVDVTSTVARPEPAPVEVPVPSDGDR